MHNVLWTEGDIFEALGVKPISNLAISHITIDSRTVQKGSLFVALKGERVDGHDYVKAALEAGAEAALVQRSIAGLPAEKLILVANTERALQQLGSFARARSKATFFGITGSVGKTGAKEMLKHALSACGTTYATSGNLNNHLGVPLTLANMPHAIDFAVIEMGMNHAGEIALLTRMAQPEIALITTVDAVHIEFFPNVEAIADAKSEIFEGMCGKKVAVLNADNPHFLRCKTRAEALGCERILAFGAAASANCRLVRYAIEGDHSFVIASIAGTEVQYKLGTIGKHWAITSVAVLAMVDAAGGNVAKAAEALAQFVEPAGRGAIELLAFKSGHLRLVDDSYNASPIAVKAAIEKIAEIRAATPEPCRTVVVLGDMLELGHHARDMHVGLLPSLINNQMDLVFAAGQFMQHLYNELPESMQGAYAPTSRDLVPRVVESLKPKDLVLVKGSHGSRMDVVVEAIKNAGRTKKEKGE